MLKIIGHGRKFFRSGWNAFDFLIVLFSWLPGNQMFSVFRAFRIFRTARLFYRVRPLKNLTEALFKALPDIGWLTVILLIFYYIFSVLSTQLFGTVNPERFGSIGSSFYYLFELMTGEGWQDILTQCPSPAAKWVFIPFMLISSYIFLNLVVGIIVTAMQDVAEPKNKKRAKNAQSEAERLNLLIEKIDILTAKLDSLESSAAGKENNNSGKHR